MIRLGRLKLTNTFLLILLITTIGLFFYSLRLEQAYIFTGDQSRDTLKVLRIWKNREITLIGPSISFTENSLRETFLGSEYLYIGLLGLLVAGFNPVGAVIPNIILFSVSIPVFYKLTELLIRSKEQRLFATVFYTISPETVTHARFFWNPNLIIPMSVFFWFFILKDPKEKKLGILLAFLAGVCAGLEFNFHYLVAIPIIVYLIAIFLKKQFVKFLLVVVGMLIGVGPILLFEIKHHFYLTSSLIYNLSHPMSHISLKFGEALVYFLNIFWSPLGLKEAEIYFPIVFKLSDGFLVIASLAVLILGIIRRGKVSNIPRIFWLSIAIGVLLTIYFSAGELLRLRYLFGIYPLLIWWITNLLWRLNLKKLTYIFLIPAIICSYLITQYQPSVSNLYIPISKIAQISEVVVKDNPKPNYNLTENIHNDARALSFRYFVEKDAKIEPYDELSYYNLNSLYVISPSLAKIYKENRWEFFASSPWKLVWSQDFGEVKLFKFTK